jgi:hypothetical protein
MKVFLDTCVVNRLVDFGEYYFDGYLGDEPEAEYVRRPIEDRQDIDALHAIVQVFQRASMPLYVTPTTLDEVKQANRSFLDSYAWELFHHWWDWGDPEVRRRLMDSNFEERVQKQYDLLKCFRGTKDRRLIAEAIVLGCDVFLTVDRRSICKKRARADTLPLRILRPVELWDELMG